MQRMSELSPAVEASPQHDGALTLARRFGGVNALGLAAHLLAFGGSIVLAHRLDAATFGLLALANVIAGYVALAGRFGTELTLVRELTGVSDPHAEFAILSRLRGQISLVIGALVALVVIAVLPGFKSAVIVMSIVGAALLVLDPGGLFDLAGRITRHAALALARQAAFTLSSIAAVLWLSDHTAALTLTFVRIPLALCFLIWTWKVIGLSRGTWSAPTPAGAMRALLVRNARPWLALLAHQIYLNADQLLIAAILGEVALAPYAIASALAQIGLISTGALHRVLNPGLVAALQRYDGRHYVRTLLATFAVSLSLGIGFWLTAPPVIAWVYPQRLSEAAASIPAFTVWIVLSGTGGYAAYALLAGRRDGAYLGAVVSGAVVNLALNAWAIPKFGALGAAWSTVASQAIASGLSLLLSLGLMRARREVR